MHPILSWFGFIALAYLAGSIPFGLLIGFARGVDIRTLGSGNIGATNAGRVLGRTIGGVCFALDVLKGAVPVAVAGVTMNVWGDATPAPADAAWWTAVAAAAMLGHMFPVWLRFKGGKGVATGFGALAAMWPIVAPAAWGALAVWLVGVRATKYVGVTSCAAAAVLPIFVMISAIALGDPATPTLSKIIAVWPAVAAVSALAIVVIWKHRGNIRRTIAGTEPRTYLLGGRPKHPA